MNRTEIDVRMEYKINTGLYPIPSDDPHLGANSLVGALKPETVEEIMPYLEWLEAAYLDALQRMYGG